MDTFLAHWTSHSCLDTTGSPYTQPPPTWTCPHTLPLHTFTTLVPLVWFGCLHTTYLVLVPFGFLDLPSWVHTGLDGSYLHSLVPILVPTVGALPLPSLGGCLGGAFSTWVGLGAGPGRLPMEHTPPPTAGGLLPRLDYRSGLLLRSGTFVFLVLPMPKLGACFCLTCRLDLVR